MVEPPLSLAEIERVEFGRMWHMPGNFLQAQCTWRCVSALCRLCAERLGSMSQRRQSRSARHPRGAWEAAAGARRMGRSGHGSASPGGGCGRRRAARSSDIPGIHYWWRHDARTPNGVGGWGRSSPHAWVVAGECCELALGGGELRVGARRTRVAGRWRPSSLAVVRCAAAWSARAFLAATPTTHLVSMLVCLVA